MGLYEDELARVQARWSRFKVIPKSESHFMKVIAWILKNVLRTGDDFMTRFVTTIGPRMWVNEGWDARPDRSKFFTLVHETTHTEQFFLWPFGRFLWPLNALLFPLAYLLALPARWTMRARFEREAFTRQLSVMVAYGDLLPKEPSHVKWVLDWLGPLFGGRAYFWMWSERDARTYFTDLLRRLAEGERFH